MDKYLGLSSKQMILLISAALFNFLVYFSSRLIAADFKHYNLTIALDEQIPFLSWTVLIYWGCFIFWIINYYIGVKYDKGKGYRFIGSHFIGEAVCFFVFVFFPTTMTRAANPGISLFDKIIGLTYTYDAPDNLFPSIHCFVSWLCWIAVRKNRKIPAWYQKLSLLMAVLVCISTLTVKQHVIADVPAGILLAELSYLLAGRLDG